MRKQVNIVLVEGRLESDPQLHTDSSGHAIGKMVIQNNRYYFKGSMLQAEIATFTILSFGMLAQTCSKFLKKGSLVLISGEVFNKRGKMYIRASNVKNLSVKKEEEKE